ncbi:hypothetical protein D3C80_1684800 [compost metagenome]
MQVRVGLEELNAVDAVSVHRVQRLVIGQRPAHIVVHVSEIMINPVNVQRRRILKIAGRLLPDDNNGSNADDQIRDEDNDGNQDHNPYIMADGKRLGCCCFFGHGWVRTGPFLRDFNNECVLFR